MSHSGTSQSLLGPGWKQVSDTEWAALANDDEYEDIEEELYVTMDLGTYVSPTVLMRADQCQLVGLDTPNPWLKIGNHVYCGIHDQLIGSEILFRTKKDPENPLDATHTPFDRTDRRITFRAMVPKAKASSSKRAKETEQGDMDDELSDHEAIRVEDDEAATPVADSIEAPFGLTKSGKPKKRPGPRPGTKRSAPRPLSLSPTPLGEDGLPRSPSPDPLHPVSESAFQIPEDGIPIERTAGGVRDVHEREEQEKLQRKMQAIEKSVEAEVLGMRTGRRRGTKVIPMLPGFQGSERLDRDRAKQGKGKGKEKEPRGDDMQVDE